MLRAVPIFKYDGEILSLPLTDDLDDFPNEVIARDTRRNGLVWPTNEPPLPWSQVRTGGLSSNHWARVPLIKRRLIENVWRKSIGIGQMQPVLDALNHLQSPAFMINKPVLNFIKRLGFSKLPSNEKDFPHTDEWKWAVDEWKTLARAWELDMVIADSLSSLGHFYIPLALEFRGRVSLIPYFHYQRDDHVRGLFLFHKGETINRADRSASRQILAANVRFGS